MSIQKWQNHENKYTWIIKKCDPQNAFLPNHSNSCTNKLSKQNKKEPLVSYLIYILLRAVFFFIPLLVNIPSISSRSIPRYIILYENTVKNWDIKCQVNFTSSRNLPLKYLNKDPFSFFLNCASIHVYIPSMESLSFNHPMQPMSSFAFIGRHLMCHFPLHQHKISFIGSFELLLQVRSCYILYIFMLSSDKANASCEFSTFHKTF